MNNNWKNQAFLSKSVHFTPHLDKNMWDKPVSVAIQMGGKPVLTIGWDGEIHGIRSNSTNAVYQIPFSQNLRQRKNLFNGYTKLSKILKRR